MSATDSKSTKNTKGNRKVVTADYNFPKAIFKIPDGLDLQDKKVVKSWDVHGMYMNIHYVDGREETIEWEWDPTEERADWKYPDIEIEDAEDWDFEYSDDDEEVGLFYVMAEMRVEDGLEPRETDRFQDAETALMRFHSLVEKIKLCRDGSYLRVEMGECNEEGDPTETIECYVNYDEEEKEDQYPTIEEILSKMKELKEDENDWDDDTIYDAICEWDDKFADDPNWFDEEYTDVKDSLRDRVCIHLGLEGLGELLGWEKEEVKE